MRYFLFLIVFCASLLSVQAQNATLKGVVLNENNQPLSNVNISTSAGNGTVSNINGFYSINLPANKSIQVVFSHVSYKNITLTITLKDGADFEFNPVLKTQIAQISEITLVANQNKLLQGVTHITPQQLRKIPGANAGVENILLTLPGVSNNNELSTQYNVRGGNYDENLVYVNEIEVYRPFLIRSGQQEGLSFVNSNMVQNIYFSAGGFQAKYGDKLSSVLDITYKIPDVNYTQITANLLGASATLATKNKNGKWLSINGIRYRDNSLLVNSKETQTDFNPLFADFQSYTTYRASSQLEFNFLGTASINRYKYKPLTRQTNFGSLLNPVALIINYQGKEDDAYKTALGAFKATYFANKNLTLKLIASGYVTTEREYFDLLAQYELADINTDFSSDDLGQVTFSQGIGSQLNHGRNTVNASIFNITHKGNYQVNNNQIEWGATFTHEAINDRIVEWEVIDSTGFSIRPPLAEFNNNQPYQPFVAPLTPYQNIRAKNNTTINRVSGFTQWSKRLDFNNQKLYINLGARTHFWNVSAQNNQSSSDFTISPRAQISFKPNWETDMVFKLSGGWYHQPPFYRELRDSTGNVVPDVKAQESIHFVAGHEYSFTLWKSPFKLISEAYYKKLNNVNTYTVENVRVRYRANNNATAYAYGLDLRLHGAFVPGTESWFSFGYLKTQENLNNRGYIARPTDQRLKFALLFQDYVPNIPQLKMYLNMVYNTGLPGGSPSYANPYLFQNRLRDYKRADLGIWYVLTDYNNQFKKGHWLHKFKELSVGFEIFNIFDVQNAITNTWVRDVYSKQQFGIPNFMTGRVFNVKLNMQL